MFSLKIFSSKNNVNQVKNKLNKLTSKGSMTNNNVINFKKISTSGMKKIDKRDGLYLKKQYYKCIIYIFSLSIILLKNGNTNLKLSAIKKFQNHLKKIDNKIRDFIINNYYNKLFKNNYNFNEMEKISKIKTLSQDSNLSIVNLIDNIDESIILNTLENYNDNDITKFINQYKEILNELASVYKNSYNSNKFIFYRINKELFKELTFSFKKDISEILGLEKKGSIKFNEEKIGHGSYANVYEIKGANNIILKILKLNSISKNNQKKSFLDEYNAIQKSLIIGEKCDNCVCNIFDYGIVSIRDTHFLNKELYYIMEKGLLTLKEVRDKRNLNTKNKIELILLLINIIIILVKKIKCIHNNGFLHLDVKDRNIMIFKGDKNNHDIRISNEIKNLFELDTNYILVKYIDFGFSAKVEGNKIFNEKRGIIKNNYKGTGHYFYLNEKDGKFLYSKYSDLFSLSRILLEIIIKDMDVRYYNKRDNKKQLPTNDRFYIKVINNEDIELFFNEIGISKLNKNSRNKLISNIKDILPDADDNIKCIIEKNNNGSIKKSTTTNLPFIVENCHDVYIENINEFLNNLSVYTPKYYSIDLSDQ